MALTDGAAALEVEAGVVAAELSGVEEAAVLDVAGNVAGGGEGCGVSALDPPEQALSINAAKTGACRPTVRPGRLTSRVLLHSRIWSPVVVGLAWAGP